MRSRTSSREKHIKRAANNGRESLGENITRAHGRRTKKEGAGGINDPLFIREMRFVHKLSREPRRQTTSLRHRVGNLGVDFRYRID